MKNSKSGKTIFLQMSIWYNESTGKIHLATPEVPGVITTVNDNPESKRGHPNLYMKLSKCLRAAGAPAPPIR